MSITDELRKWARACTVRGMVLTTYPEKHEVRGTLEDLTAIADRIDAEHEAKVSYWQGASYKDGYDDGFASADDWLAQHEDAMAEHGWMRLPVDADGEYIHIGDELECIEALHPEVPARFKVQDMFYRGNGEWHLRAYPATYDPKKCRHHHERTVEELLRDYASRILIASCIDEEDELVAEYAAKLRLAGDAK